MSQREVVERELRSRLNLVVDEQDLIPQPEPEAISWARYSRAVPVHAAGAFGLVPVWRLSGSKPVGKLQRLSEHEVGFELAVHTVGKTGTRLLYLLSFLGGRATANRLAYETQGADRELVESALVRLVDAKLVRIDAGGNVWLGEQVADYIPEVSRSWSDPQAMTSAQLEQVCRTLKLAVPTRKQERIETITTAFADSDTATRIRSNLSDQANSLLGTLAATAGLGVMQFEAVGLSRYAAQALDRSRFSYLRAGQQTAAEPAAVSALQELVERGVVGTSVWDDELWIWSEAWPLLERPFFLDWSVHALPEVVSAPVGPIRIPAIVSVLDRAISSWRAQRAAVLKNGEARLPKTDLRRLAKALNTSVETVDLVSQLAIGIGLLEPLTVSRTGRGRNQVIKQVWALDEELVAGWEELEPAARWLRLLREWTQPTCERNVDVFVNRHLFLWELACLEPGVGWAHAGHFAEWFRDEYLDMATAEHIKNAVDQLRLLGFLNSSQSVALSALGAIALEDPRAVAKIEFPQSDKAIVQADHTVVSPPDLRADLASNLTEIAVLENDAGALTYRLDAELITRAVQGGRTAASIVDFLTDLSSVPISDTVARLVNESASAADDVLLIRMPTVVVVKEPADLVLACSVKAAKLTAVTDTVAVSELPESKVLAALQRKRLVPKLLLAGNPPGSRTSKVAARVPGEPASVRSGEQKTATAVSKQIASRLVVKGPLGITPDLVAKLDRGR